MSVRSGRKDIPFPAGRVILSSCSTSLTQSLHIDLIHEHDSFLSCSLSGRLFSELLRVLAIFNLMDFMY